MPSTSSTANPNPCDQEPIHLIGAIQPHGCLLVVDTAHYTVERASTNCSELLGMGYDDLLGESVLSWMSEQDRRRFTRQALSCVKSKEPKPANLTLTTGAKTRQFTVLVHSRDPFRTLVMELEPCVDAECLLTFVDFYDQFSSAISNIQGATSIHSLCDSVVREVREITSFDRVWIHRVVQGEHLKVIAEQKRADQDAFLNLHFPAGDIPQQARALFFENRIRVISDVNAVPVSISPGPNNFADKPLDLSQSILRAVAPVHLEYLRNMHVEASMSVSVIKNGTLWGLISCHHNMPKILSYQERAACDFLGRIVSLQLPILEAQLLAETEVQLRQHAAGILEVLSAPDLESLFSGLTAKKDAFLSLVGADGAVVCVGNEPPLMLGITPPPDALASLCDYVMRPDAAVPFATDHLAHAWPPASKWTPAIGGLLAVSLSQSHKYIVMWFRRERVQVVSWGGDPHKTGIDALPAQSISPRKSFAAWNEQVRGHSLQWAPAEQKMALEFRLSFMAIAMTRAKQHAQLNVELAASNVELDAFAYAAAHDLKEPLRGIHIYATFLLEDYADKIDAAGRHKLMRLNGMTQRMDALLESLLQFARVGHTQLVKHATDITSVVADACNLLSARLDGTDVAIRIMSPLPTVTCDRIRAIEVFHNLISNALKYNDNAHKVIEVGCAQSVDSKHASETILFVRDNGIGIADAHHDEIFKIFRRLHSDGDYGGGSGAGLTIVKRIIERHGGRIWLNSYPGKGTTFYFTLGSPQESETQPTC